MKGLALGVYNTWKREEHLENATNRLVGGSLVVMLNQLRRTICPHATRTRATDDTSASLSNNKTTETYMKGTRRGKLSGILAKAWILAAGPMYIVSTTPST